jgi:cell division protein FtsB
MWITSLVCTAFLLATLAQAWSNSTLMEQVQKEQLTLNQVKAKHAQLQRAAEHYKDPAVIESEARQQLGYVRPGEQAVVVVNADSQSQKQAGAQKNTVQQRGHWQDWWQILFGNTSHK